MIENTEEKRGGDKISTWTETPVRNKRCRRGKIGWITLDKHLEFFDAQPANLFLA